MLATKEPALSDEERAKRIRDTAREIGTDNDPKEKAFGEVAKRAKPASEKA